MQNFFSKLWRNEEKWTVKASPFTCNQTRCFRWVEHPFVFSLQSSQPRIIHIIIYNNNNDYYNLFSFNISFFYFYLLNYFNSIIFSLFHSNSLRLNNLYFSVIFLLFSYCLFTFIPFFFFFKIKHNINLNRWKRTN